jgi:outer membrane protein TolC
MKVWLPKLENMKILSLEAIKLIVNNPNIKIQIPQKKLKTVPFNMNLPAIQDIAIENRPEVKLLKAAIRAIQYQKKSEFADYLPQIGAMGKIIYRYDNFDSNQDWEFLGGIGIKWNFLNGGLTYNKIKEKKKELSILKEKLKMLKNGINFEVKKAFKVFKQNEKQLKIRKEALHDAIKKLKEVKQGYQYQISTTKDLNEAQVQKRWAEANYLFKKLDYVNSLININYVTGKFITNLQ